MRASLLIRNAVQADHSAINAVATAAWSEYASRFTGWEGLAAFIAQVAAIACECDLVVAERAGAIVGVVGYVAPRRSREAIFPDDWAVIRMLSVYPSARRRGLGAALTHECIERAVRDGATTVGLHTSAIMESAVRLYQRLGFRYQYAIPDRRGVPYGVFALDLRRRQARSEKSTTSNDALFPD